MKPCAHPARRAPTAQRIAGQWDGKLFPAAVVADPQLDRLDGV
jgi:hypothetical protein